MLSIAIKNSILVILIILILHFFIKNVILEKSTEKFSTFNVDSTKSDTDKLCTVDDSAKKTDFYNDELMQYVKNGDIELDKYFQDNIVTESDTTQCKKIDDKQLPLSSTCSPDIQKLSDNEDTMKITSDCGTQDKKIMILKEYADEKTMNGGKLFNDINLTPYDDFDINYQEW